MKYTQSTFYAKGLILYGIMTLPPFAERLGDGFPPLVHDLSLYQRCSLTQFDHAQSNATPAMGRIALYVHGKLACVHDNGHCIERDWTRDGPVVHELTSST